MKYLYILLIISFCSCQNKEMQINGIATHTTLKPSKIDSLNTPEKVENFVRTLDPYLTKFTLKSMQDFNRPYPNDSIAKNLATKFGVSLSYYKADFDDNAYQDMLIIGDSHNCTTTAMDGSCSFDCFAIMNFSCDSIKLVNFVDMVGNMIVPQIIFDGNKPLLKLTKPHKLHPSNNKNIEAGSAILTYKFDNFIEYNKQPANYEIETLEFSTSGCFGSCPIYKLTVKKDRSATFLAEAFNFNKDMENAVYGQHEGYFKGIIKVKDYNKLINTLNYINFKNLKDDYSVTWTDDQTANLKITYNNGRIKYITDYGMVGTYGLMAIYQQFADLRFNQNWTEVAESNHAEPR
ncbi:DUF6438 domain-containing protein [Flavobacterium coralii]|uniref:DUF6438 domain-containing protein n=1 Tax=Flavobacterium coralii TaxID=2838017 RepID=UPI0032B307A1|tara:strand:+ start:98494 stop:99537 length:1044 start_codon:yes stop_codon:yes gene_type:complete